jgi:hypothetical protein
MFLDCPACLDQDGAARCGLPAEVRCRYTMRSTDGPVQSAMIRCPAGHWFNGPVEFLTWHGRQQPDPGAAAAVHRPRRDGLTSGHNRADGSGKLAVRDVTGKPEQELPRPNGAPAYYLGRPARLWITAMRPRHRRTAFRHLIEAAAGS